MLGRWRDNLSRWGVREWSMTGLAFVVICLVVLTATRGLAFGPDGEIVRLRFGGDAQRTRVVLDLGRTTRGQVVEDGSAGRVILSLAGVSPARGLEGSGSGLVRGYEVSAASGASRVRLDLARGAEIERRFLLPPGDGVDHYRYVIDLKATGAAAAVPVAAPRREQARAEKPLIVIDAGHGGEDPGAIGPGKVYEKHVVLQISKELQRQINAEKGFRAELVRTGDYFIPLRKRTEIARKKGADLFVSIHADAAPRSAAYGASVFALSDRGATSETARWLADSENRSDLIGGAGNVSLGDKDQMLAGVLLDLSMTASLSSSLNVGQKVLSNMGRITPLHKRRVEQAGFMVLKSPDIPSILVETGFISNPSEAKKLQTSSHQQALARSIHSGVRQFFHENPPPGTYVAWLRDSGKIAAGPREHVVRSGESLALLAQRYQVSLASLRSANNLSNDVIKIGQTLNIPATTLASQP